MGLGQNLNPMTDVFTREGEDKQQIRHTQGRRLCEQAAETGAMQPEAKNARGGWGPAETARRQGRVPPKAFRGSMALLTLILDFQPPELRENKFLALSYPVCSASL